jgi:hypothetical protein
LQNVFIDRHSNHQLRVLLSVPQVAKLDLHKDLSQIK